MQTWEVQGGRVLASGREGDGDLDDRDKGKAQGAQSHSLLGLLRFSLGSHTLTITFCVLG